MGKLGYAYLPVLQTWNDPQFLTLTVSTCSAAELPERLTQLHQAFERIRDRWRQQVKRKGGLPLQCLRSLEVTAQVAAGTYHPHFHLLLPDLATTHKLLAEWLEEFKHAKAEAQQGKASYDLIGAFFYLVKPPVAFEKCKSEASAAYDVIFQALADYRLCQAYGLRHPKAQLKAQQAAEELRTHYCFDAAGQGWVNQLTGEVVVAPLRPTH
jgi:hypothetical protein